MQIAWKPNPGRQTFALQRMEFEILYGGARGGGKTDAGMAWLTRWVHKPNFRGLVLRKNAEDLKDWIDRATSMYGALGGTATGKPAQFTFPSGAIIYTGHIKDANAYTKYQGQQFQKIVWEELTHTPSEDLYEKVIQSCRSTDPELSPQIFATTNPGEAGHKWVKRRFIDVQTPMHTYNYDVDGQILNRIFIPATVDDNPVLTIADPLYVARLNSMKDEATRMRWRYGSWENYEIKGAYYSNQMNQADREGRLAIVPHDPKRTVDTFWDLGVGDSTAIWFVQQKGERIDVIDYFETNGEGLKFYVDILKQKPYTYGKHWAPHDIQVREFGTGKSRLETAYELGIKFNVVPNLSIDDGIQATREILAYCHFDAINCETGINCLTNYHKEWNDNRQTYDDKPVHDWSSHGADAFRMMAVAIRRFSPPEKLPDVNEIQEYLHQNRNKLLMDDAFRRNQQSPDSDYLQPYGETVFS